MADTKKIKVIIDGDARGVQSATKKAKSSLTGLSNSAKQLGGVLAGAFAAGAIINFAKEAVKASAVAQGVTTAFDKLGISLESLQKATRGTVDEFKLMQAAVQAKNLGVPIEELGTLFEFAQKRAQETGESVEYLTQSIVTGIGRKSVLILDNLGLSAIKVNEKFKEMGDFGKAVGAIVEEELVNMGEVGDTTATKIQQLGASFEDLKGKIGDFLNEDGGGGDFLTWLNDVIIWTGNLNQMWRDNEIEKYKSKVRDLSEEYAEISKLNDDEATPQWVKNVAQYEQKLKTITDDLNKYNDILTELTTKPKTITPDGEGGDDPDPVAPIVEETDAMAAWEVAAIAAYDADQKLIASNQEFQELLALGNVELGDWVNNLDEVGEMEDEVAEEIDKVTAAAIRQRMALKANAAAALEAAAATAALAIANGQSAKAIIQAALAVAIAESIKGAMMKSGHPIAGLILSGIAIAGVKALFENIPEFAQGGIVPGTSFSGDNVPVMVNSGEMILNRGQQAALLNGGTGGGAVVNVNGFVGNPTELAREISIVLNNESGNVSRTSFL